MKGKINTILVGAGSPSEDDVKKMFGWSAHKFGQVGNLPEGHSYKGSAPFLIDYDMRRVDLVFGGGYTPPQWNNVNLKFSLGDN